MLTVHPEQKRGLVVLGGGRLYGRRTDEWNRWTAQMVAPATNRLDFERFVVVPMVVMLCLETAINALERGHGFETAGANCIGDSARCSALPYGF